MNPRQLLRDLLIANEKVPHRAHQLEGVEQLVLDTDATRHRTIPSVFCLFDEVGAGKTKQVVDAAQILFTWRRIDTVVVLTPGYARSTWTEEDPTLGEVAKHSWDSVHSVIHEFHKDYTDLEFVDGALNWVISNYEFIRRDQRRDQLIRQLRGRRVWLVLDESWAVARFSDQMKACRMIRARRAERATLLNGTPLNDGQPEDLYYPLQILDPGIIGVPNKASFRAKYCVMGGEDGHKIIGHQNLDDFNQRVAPYVLSRRTRDCFDLPPMLDPITIEAPLAPPVWAQYKAMRDDMVAWLDEAHASVANQAIVKALRLAQITSGYLGGIEEILAPLPGQATEPTAEPIPQWLRAIQPDAIARPLTPNDAPLPATPAQVREIGRDKLDAFLHWLETFAHPPQKLLVWCRFRPELERTTRELGHLYPEVLQLTGGQTPEARRAAKALLAPGGPARRGAVVGNQKAGGASLNFAGANVAVYLSNGPSLLERTQSIGRIERPGATQPMLIVDVLATGPKGQRTIDHHILKALRCKDDMARWTVEQWRAILKTEP